LNKIVQGLDLAAGWK